MDFPVLVINRGCDTNRMQRFSNKAKRFGVVPQRIAACDAHRNDFPFYLYRDLIRDRFWGEPNIKPGALGCFLSHRRAWTHLLAGPWEYALICEDDVILAEDLGRIAALARGLGDFDILYANARMAAWAAGQNAASGSVPDPVLGLAQVVTGLAARGGPGGNADLARAPGADCYLLSRRGAERLMAATEKTGIVCGVDWAMLRLGLGAQSQGADLGKALPELAQLRDLNVLDDDPLVCHVMTQAVMLPNRGMPSVIVHEITQPIESLFATEQELIHTQYFSHIRMGHGALCFVGRSSDDPVMIQHRNGKIAENDALDALLRHFPEGGCFVDVGAHIGNHTVTMGCLGAAAKILAIEANSEITSILRANIAANALGQRVILAEAALGEQAAPGWVVPNRRHSSKSAVKLKVSPNEQMRAVGIPVQTGDDVIRAHLGDTPVDAIKVDTGGSEYVVLIGMKQTMMRCRPFILLNHWSDQLDDILQMLGPDKYERVESFAQEDEQNRLVSLLKPRM